MLKRFHPPKIDHLLRSDSDTESDDDNIDNHSLGKNFHRKRNNREKTTEKECKSSYKKEITLVNGKGSQDMEEAFKEEPGNEVMKEAKEYQEYMNQLSVPDVIQSSSADVPFTTWQSLAESMKQKYEQPLHYLTHILLKQWDESRESNKNEAIKPIGNVIHPSKAEATIWVAEQFNRQFASHHYLAKLWLSDPNYHEFVDTIIPKH